MPLPRVLLILVGLSLMAGLTVHLRGRSIRLAYEIQQLHRQQIELKQEVWRQEMEIARLWSPGLMRARVEPAGEDSASPAP